jgi:hypothetical protein
MNKEQQLALEYFAENYRAYAPVAKPAPHQAPAKPRPPTLKDFSFSAASAGGCSTSLVCNFCVHHTEDEARYNKNAVLVDWSLPLPDDFIKEMSAKFDAISSGSYSKPDTLLASTIPMTEAFCKVNPSLALGAGGQRYAVIEHILERTGWMRGACGMGQHDYPVQAWTRPSGGKQLDYTKE